jgi:WS/DGAT/MGAT family acyltransferase
MRMLSAQDATFIYLESDHSPMHIGGVYLIDSRGAPRGFGYDAFRQHIERRLSCSRIFRQRLVEVPLSLSHPCWINDPEFRLSNHLPMLQLPAPGGLEELMQLAAQVGAELTASGRWEMTGRPRPCAWPRRWFLRRHRSNHAAVDGGSGWRGGAPMDFTSTRRLIEGDTWQPEELPATVVVAEAYSRLGSKTVELGKLIGEVASGTMHAVGTRRASDRPPPAGPPSVLNGPRRPAGHTGNRFRVQLIKVRQAIPGTTVNDVVLAICAAGLRNYLLERGALPEKPLVAMAPVSVRKEDQKGRMGNQVSAMLVSLATDMTDPLQRLLHISRSTQASKIYSSALPANKIAEFIPSETLAAAARLYTRTRLGGRHRPFFNLTITNVPGPAMPLYLAGARITRQFGMAPILDGLGLIIVVLSYAGRLSLGLTSCYKVVPDPGHLGSFLHSALAELEKALASAPAAGVRELAQVPGLKRPQDSTAGESLQRLRDATRALDEAMETLKNATSKRRGK